MDEKAKAELVKTLAGKGVKVRAAANRNGGKLVAEIRAVTADDIITASTSAVVLIDGQKIAL